MEELTKYAVVTHHDGGPCPDCGSTPIREGGAWVCPKCGTRPFEVTNGKNPGTEEAAEGSTEAKGSV